MTPAPWQRGKVQTRALYGGRGTDKHSDLIATFYDDADAAYALRAVNAHESLCAALNALMDDAPGARAAAGRLLSELES